MRQQKGLIRILLTLQKRIPAIGAEEILDAVEEKPAIGADEIRDAQWRNLQPEQRRLLCYRIESCNGSRNDSICCTGESNG